MRVAGSGGVVESRPRMRAVRVGGMAGVVLLAVSLAACGSSSSSDASKAAVQSVCTQVSAVLSDGPDPGADPVGYAEAQILPLRQIKTSDKSLEGLIDGLASAYQSFSSTNGDAAATKAESAAQNKVNAVCPGAAQ
jgi:hypothetical protein